MTLTSGSSSVSALPASLRAASTHFLESPAQHSPRVQPGTRGARSRGRSRRLPLAVHGRRHLGSSRASSTPSAWIGRAPSCGNDLCTRLVGAPAAAACGQARRPGLGSLRDSEDSRLQPRESKCSLLAPPRAPCLFGFFFIGEESERTGQWTEYRLDVICSLSDVGSIVAYFPPSIASLG